MFMHTTRQAEAVNPGKQAGLFELPIKQNQRTSQATGTEIIDYIESLLITQGPLAGERVKLFKFQRKFIKSVYAETNQVPISALSVARGAGKTTFLAALTCCYIDPCGPLHEPRASICIMAASFNQGQVLFRHLLAFIGQKHNLTNLGARSCDWKVLDGTNKAYIEHKYSGASVELKANKPETLHGLSPNLFVLDEPAQLKGERGELAWNAVKTSLGKMSNSKVIVIGTRPSIPTHFFQRLIDDTSETVHAQVHAANEGDNPHKKSTWLKACPALNKLPELLKAYRRESAEAEQDQDALAQFKALRLNMGTEEVRMPNFINPDIWTAHCEVSELPKRDGVVIWGLDLGQSNSMSAISSYWPTTGRLEVVAALPERPHSLAQRSKMAGIPKLYESMVERGELIIYPDYVIPVDSFLTLCLERFGTKPNILLSDRYRQSELMQSIHLLRWQASVPIAFRGTGYFSANEDIKFTKRAVLQNKIKMSESLLMRSALRESRIQRDPAGNEKLNKLYSKGHNDDALAATLLAVGHGIRHYDPDVYKPTPVYLGSI